MYIIRLEVFSYIHFFMIREEKIEKEYKIHIV